MELMPVSAYVYTFLKYKLRGYMSKLGVANKFFDVSDYGRPVAKMIAATLKNTRVTAIHITLLFGVSGILAIVYMLKAQFLKYSVGLLQTEQYACSEIAIPF